MPCSTSTFRRTIFHLKLVISLNLPTELQGLYTKLIESWLVFMYFFLKMNLAYYIFMIKYVLLFQVWNKAGCPRQCTGSLLFSIFSLHSNLKLFFIVWTQLFLGVLYCCHAVLNPSRVKSFMDGSRARMFIFIFILALFQELFHKSKNDALAALADENAKLLKCQSFLEEKLGKSFVGFSLHQTLEDLIQASLFIIIVFSSNAYLSWFRWN